MSATVEIRAKRATIDGWRWTSKDSDLAGVLNLLLDPDGPSGADPNPDVHAAEAAIRQLGGTLVDFDEMEYVEGRVY